MPFTPSLLDSPGTLFDEDLLDSGGVLPPANTPTFSIAANPASVTVVQGATITTTVTMTPVDGYVGTAALSASGLPTGVTAAFVPASLTGGGAENSVLTLTAAFGATVVSGASVTITAFDSTNDITEHATVLVTVDSAAPTPFANPFKPNLPDFLIFLADVQIPTAALPTNSPWPGYALAQALTLVIRSHFGGIMYTLAVYNCATAILFLITPDQSGQTYFADARSSETSENFPSGGFGLLVPTTGLVVASSDEGTSSTLTAPIWAAGLTIDQLGFYKTVWGRNYLAFNQKYGPNIVGVT
jgi:hypothetical protein